MPDEVPSPPARSPPLPPTEEPADPPTSPEPAVEPEPDWGTRYKYLLADFENFRRRAERERENARQIARADLLRALLPIAEAAERAREAAQPLSPADPFRKGIELLAESWRSFLDSQRVAPVAERGGRFQSDLHEAVGEAPPSKGAPDGTIAEVVQQGYRMGPQLLRPAKVIVARTPRHAVPPESAAAAAMADDDKE